MHSPLVITISGVAAKSNLGFNAFKSGHDGGQRLPDEVHDLLADATDADIGEVSVGKCRSGRSGRGRGTCEVARSCHGPKCSCTIRASMEKGEGTIRGGWGQEGDVWRGFGV